MADTKPTDSDNIGIDAYVASLPKDAKGNITEIDKSTKTGMLSAISGAGDTYHQLEQRGEAEKLDYKGLQELALNAVDKEDLFLDAAGTKGPVREFTKKLIADSAALDKAQNVETGTNLRKFLHETGDVVNGIDPATGKPIEVVDPSTGKSHNVTNFKEVHDHIQEASKGGLAAIPHGKWLGDHQVDFDEVDPSLNFLNVA